MGLDYKNIWKIDPSLNTQSNFIDDFNALLDFLRNAPGNFGTPPLIDFFPLPEAPIPEFQDNYVELNDQYILYNWSPSNNTYNDEKIEFTTLGFNEIADNKIISLTSISGTTLFDNKVKRIYTDRLTNRDKIEEQFQIYCTEYKTEEL